MSLVQAVNLLCCPKTQESLTLGQTGRELICEGSAGSPLRYPVISGIPWIFRDTEAVMWQWKQSVSLHTALLQEGEKSLKDELKKEGLSALAKRRLKLLRDAKIRDRRFAESLFRELGRSSLEGVDDLRVMAEKIPVSQSLTGYASNLHRDWGWNGLQETDENGLSLECVLKALDGAGLSQKSREIESLAVLGAGGCRLTHDLHHALGVKRTIACDLNPFLLNVAHRVISGEALELTEYPLAPKSLENHAVVRQLRLPEGVPAGEAGERSLTLVQGNALNSPLKAGAFSAVLTPWFVDIVPERPQDVFRRVNALLKPEGIWINFGTLVFHTDALADRMSLEEVREGVVQAGFEMLFCEHTTLPYMASPASCHSRRERVVCFVARKVEEKGLTKAYEYLPSWAKNHAEAVPVSPQMVSFFNKNRLSAQLASLVDGKRSVDDAVALMVKNFGMQPEEARSSFLKFAVSVFESGQTRFL